MHSILNPLLNPFLGFWAYLLLALSVMVEGPVATLAGSVAAAGGYMKPPLVFLFAASGNLLSDILWYTLGYLGKREWLHRYGKYFGLREEMVNQLLADIETHAAKLLFIAKLTMGFTIPTLVSAGLAKVPVRRWLHYLVAGEIIWTGSLVFLGLTFGRYVGRLERGVEYVALGGGLLCAALVIYYLSRLRKRAAEKKLSGMP